ncbi:Cytoplasmic dynein 1 light intermediate chain 1 [Ceratocystis lukuohia]|uniref:Cytoplasmic dynein 1 light intermediate chain 1 n=2 Tax=Ceratocystis TaxID=5157 RepID=A0A0F8DHU5_CERFI|nr:Cytoplasmic dynein 1 light intermediate chain 1 [Ceratocystis platani]
MTSGANANRMSTLTVASTTASDSGRGGLGLGSSNGNGSSSGNGDVKKDLWLSMLDTVATGKKLPEKNLLVLGGSPDSQREFLDSLSSGEQRWNVDRQSDAPPIANNFALGYTYYDVLEGDQEDTLARISLHLLSTPSPSFTSLLQPLLTPETIPDTLIVVLLDWSQPHLWLRQLREWILMLRQVLITLDDDCGNAMEQLMDEWRDRGRGGGSLNLDGTQANEDAGAALPLGPGEWEDGLGLPLCVVCQNADKMELLEKTHGWKEADFDQILQYLRTVLLRLHSSLGITSLLKKQPLKHNTIDRDKILVPPNWDSWGKIRVLRDGFDVETISAGWAEDLQKAWPIMPDLEFSDQDDEGLDLSAVTLYEDWVPDASMSGLHIPGPSLDSTSLETNAADTQSFLAEQTKVLESAKALSEPKPGTAARRKPGALPDESERFGDSEVRDHIGPVQVNMGGIQVDADDMLRRLKDRQAFANGGGDVTPEEQADPGAVPDVENLQAFFSGLMNRKGATGGVTNGSPRS